MKKFYLLLLSLLFVSMASNAQKTTTITKFEGKPIKGIIVSGAFDIQLSQGENASAKVEINEELVDKLTFTHTGDGIIELNFKSDIAKYFTKTKSRPLAVIVVNQLDFVNVTGACSLIAKGQFTTDNLFRLYSSGNAFVSWINVTCQKAVCEVSGNSKIDDCSIKANETVSMVVGGSSKTNCKVTADKLFLNISGTSDMNLTGKANSSEVSTTGTSSLDMLGFDAATQSAELRGISSIKATVNGKANVEIGGTSTYKFTGTGVVTGAGAKRLD